MKALDSATACDETVCDGMEAHSTALRCLDLPRLAGSYPDLSDTLKFSPMLYQDTLKQLLNCLRLFSFTSSAWPPPPSPPAPFEPPKAEAEAETEAEAEAEEPAKME